MSLAIHLIFSSRGTQAQTHHGASTHTHTHAPNNHVCTCVLALRLVFRSVCDDLSTPLLTFFAVLWYTIPWGSIHSFSVFLWALCFLSFSQVSHSVKLTHQGTTGGYNTAAYKLKYICFCFKTIMAECCGDTFEEACLPLSLSLSLSLFLSKALLVCLCVYCIMMNILTNF